MSFWQKVLLRSTALLKAALTLVLFIGVTYIAAGIFGYLRIDRNIYRGTFNFFSCLFVFIAMFVLNRINRIKKAPLIKTGKIGPDQAVALVIIALGMLGMVAAYLGITELIAANRAPLNEAIEEYRESVDRFSDVPQVVIPVWDSVLYVFTLCFIVPVTEEMTFRGAVFGYIREGFGPWTTVILSAVGFGIMHGLTIHIGYALACGLIIAACYHITDSIIAPVLLHMIFNIFGSGIPTLMSVEEFGIPPLIKSTFMRGVNTTAMLFMPVSVLAFAYLVNVRRKKAKEAAAQAEMMITAEGTADGTFAEETGSDESISGDNGAGENGDAL